jgi:hypothetical protein
MNCDDFLPFLETGGPLRRMQARRHASCCPRCAAVHAKFLAAKAQLARPDALSNHARELWSRAARDTLAHPLRRHPWVPVAVGLATAACVLVAVLRPVIRDMGVRSIPIVDAGSSIAPVVGPTTVFELDPIPQLTELASAADRLGNEIRALQSLAERFDAEREVAMTLNQYGNW